MASRKKTFNIILIILIAVFIIAQFFGPEENTYQQVPDTDIAKVENVPAEVMSILKTSCYDCHSNNTSYPWYDKITLVNYYLAEHVEDGKKHVILENKCILIRFYFSPMNIIQQLKK